VARAAGQPGRQVHAEALRPGCAAHHPGRRAEAGAEHQRLVVGVAGVTRLRAGAVQARGLHRREQHRREGQPRQGPAAVPDGDGVMG